MRWDVLLDGGFDDHRYHYHLIRSVVKSNKVGNSEWHLFEKRCLLARRCFLMSLEPERKTQGMFEIAEIWIINARQNTFLGFLCGGLLSL